jgi:HAD superfamily hydrolase (TIGR01509 family)
MRARALVFDFNGTLSHDEPLLAQIYEELFAAYGRPLSAQEYFDRLAGHSDEEIVRRWLGADHPAAEEAIRERVERYCALADGSTVPEAVRAAVRYAAARVPVAVCSAALRREIEPVLAGAGLADVLTLVVSADDVARPKPDPEGYLRTLALLGSTAADTVAFEDTDVGVAAAKGAGLVCYAVAGTVAPERLAAADELVPALDVELVERLLA